MERKNLLGVFAFAMIAMLGVSAVSAYGFGMGQGELSEEDLSQREANHEAMQNAIETGDYAAWEGLMNERLSEMEDSINEETFAEIQTRHAEREDFRLAMEEARESGDWSEVEALKDEYGIEGRGMGNGQGRGMHQEGRGMGHGMMLDAV